MNAKANPAIKDELEKDAGKKIPLLLVSAQKTVEVIVAGKDSPAKRNGWDLIFVACSERCWTSLRQVLAKDTGDSTAPDPPSQP